jgi:hypothetical protein
MIGSKSRAVLDNIRDDANTLLQEARTGLSALQRTADDFSVAFVLVATCAVAALLLSAIALVRQSCTGR